MRIDREARCHFANGVCVSLIVVHVLRLLEVEPVVLAVATTGMTFIAAAYSIGCAFMGGKDE